MVRSDRPRLGRRTWRGVAYGPQLTLEERTSLLVVGPTQAGKTSSLVVPAILEWTGPLIVTSVKSDVITSTRRWRETLGEVQLLEPGDERGLTWNPLEGVHTFRHAMRVARDLTIGGSVRGDTEFWNALATKLVASLFTMADENALSIFDVASVIEERTFDRWLSTLRVTSASGMLRTFLEHEPRTLDGVVTTAETMLLPWRFVQPLASLHPMLEGSNTLYLCSPRGEQVHYESLFRGALRMLLERQQHLVERRRQHRLLLVLDEAATVAPLEELDQLAATVGGLDVTLLTVVQDFAQMKARWGARASTIVNNHGARVVVGGLADPTAATYLPELSPDDESRQRPLRQRPVGSALLIAGRQPVREVGLRPWWRDRRLRRRAGHSSITTIRK